MVPSAQQEQIYTWFRDADGSRRARKAAAVVVARAGCGKTTTIIQGVKEAPEDRILLCAFNAKIADELTSRLTGSRAKAKTLHGVGYSAVLRFWENIPVQKSPLPGQSRAERLTERVCGGAVPDAMKKLITKIHSKAREMNPLAAEPGSLIEMIQSFDLMPDETWQADGYDAAYLEVKALAAMELAANAKPVDTGIDYADMIFLPVRNQWLRPAYDLVVVDEMQDMNAAQLIIARGVCKGRFAGVGDNRQAIYGFRGADAGSIDRMAEEMKAERFGLTTTYRCGRAIVDLAAQIVPDFTAGPANPEGAVSGLCGLPKLVEAATLGDFVLSRKNAPLAAVAVALLRAGKRTRVAGRNIGNDLRKILKSVAKGRAGSSIPELLERLTRHGERESVRWLAAGREDKAEAARDAAATIIEIAQGAGSVAEVDQKLDILFTDDGLGQAGVITCSSIHRSKGLEAERVFVLADTLKDGSEEELNLRYVAITRAKRELVMVAGVS